jgi:hypothetical protein
MAIWHVLLNGTPLCTSPLLAERERIEFPLCGTRNRQLAEARASDLRASHPDAEVTVVDFGCHARGE